MAAEFDFEAAFGCPVPLLFREQSGPAPEQKDQNDDQQQQAEASSIVMIWGSIIETSSTEQEDQNNQENDNPHRFTPVGGAPLQRLTIISAGGYDKVGLEVVDVDLARSMHRPPRLAEVCG